MSFSELIVGHGAYLVSHDLSADRVLDVRDRSLDRDVQVVAVLEHAVTRRINGAILKRQVIDIAEQLLTTEMTTHELHVLRVPGNVLAVDLGIVDRHILTLPERVLRRDVGMVHLYILAVLEDVLRVRRQSVDIDMVGVHERISALVERHVLDLHIMDMPECLISIVDRDILQRQIVHLTEELRPVNNAVLHHHVVAVPDSGAGTLGEVAARDQAAVHMPPGVLAEELTVMTLHVMATFDTGLTVRDGNIVKLDIVGTEQRALTSKG